ncbi:MAG: hypothetical protein QGM49_05380 [Actinomycetota bacterium]|nr:hypothetical protein [Actinomycetota bacterium]
MCVWCWGWFEQQQLIGRGELFVPAVGGCWRVCIGFVSSIWFMGLIVEEDPLSRVLFGLSKERNLTGFPLLGGLDAAIPPVVTGKTAADRLHQQLQISLNELVTSEDRQRALTVAARFRDYSFADTQLISAKSLDRGFTPSGVARNDKQDNQVVPVSATLTIPETARLLGIGRNLAYEIAGRDGEIAGCR